MRLQVTTYCVEALAGPEEGELELLVEGVVFLGNDYDEDPRDGFRRHYTYVEDAEILEVREDIPAGRIFDLRDIPADARWRMTEALIEEAQER